MTGVLSTATGAARAHVSAMPATSTAPSARRGAVVLEFLGGGAAAGSRSVVPTIRVRPRLGRNQPRRLFPPGRYPRSGSVRSRPLAEVHRGRSSHDVSLGTWIEPYAGDAMTLTNVKDQPQAQQIPVDHAAALARGGATAPGTNH